MENKTITLIHKDTGDVYDIPVNKAEDALRTGNFDKAVTMYDDKDGVYDLPQKMADKALWEGKLKLNKEDWSEKAPLVKALTENPDWYNKLYEASGKGNKLAQLGVATLETPQNILSAIPKALGTTLALAEAPFSENITAKDALSGKYENPARVLDALEGTPDFLKKNFVETPLGGISGTDILGLGTELMTGTGVAKGAALSSNWLSKLASGSKLEGVTKDLASSASKLEKPIDVLFGFGSEKPSDITSTDYWVDKALDSATKERQLKMKAEANRLRNLFGEGKEANILSMVDKALPSHYGLDVIEQKTGLPTKEFYTDALRSITSLEKEKGDLLTKMDSFLTPLKEMGLDGTQIREILLGNTDINTLPEASQKGISDLRSLMDSMYKESSTIRMNDIISNLSKKIPSIKGESIDPNNINMIMGQLESLKNLSTEDLIKYTGSKKELINKLVSDLQSPDKEAFDSLLQRSLRNVEDAPYLENYVRNIPNENYYLSKVQDETLPKTNREYTFLEKKLGLPSFLKEREDLIPQDMLEKDINKIMSSYINDFLDYKYNKPMLQKASEIRKELRGSPILTDEEYSSFVQKISPSIEKVIEDETIDKSNLASKIKSLINPNDFNNVEHRLINRLVSNDSELLDNILSSRGRDINDLDALLGGKEKLANLAFDIRLNDKAVLNKSLLFSTLRDMKQTVKNSINEIRKINPEYDYHKLYSRLDNYIEQLGKRADEFTVKDLYSTQSRFNSIINKFEKGIAKGENEIAKRGEILSARKQVPSKVSQAIQNLESAGTKLEDLGSKPNISSLRRVKSNLVKDIVGFENEVKTALQVPKSEKYVLETSSSIKEIGSSIDTMNSLKSSLNLDRLDKNLSPALINRTATKYIRAIEEVSKIMDKNLESTRYAELSSKYKNVLNSVIKDNKLSNTDKVKKFRELTNNVIKDYEIDLANLEKLHYRKRDFILQNPMGKYEGKAVAILNNLRETKNPLVSMESDAADYFDKFLLDTLGYKDSSDFLNKKTTVDFLESIGKAFGNKDLVKHIASKFNLELNENATLSDAVDNIRNKFYTRALGGKLSSVTRNLFQVMTNTMPSIGANFIKKSTYLPRAYKAMTDKSAWDDFFKSGAYNKYIISEFNKEERNLFKNKGLGKTINKASEIEDKALMSFFNAAEIHNRFLSYQIGKMAAKDIASSNSKKALEKFFNEVYIPSGDKVRFLKILKEKGIDAFAEDYGIFLSDNSNFVYKNISRSPLLRNRVFRNLVLFSKPTFENISRTYRSSKLAFSGNKEAMKEAADFLIARSLMISLISKYSGMDVNEIAPASSLGLGVVGESPLTKLLFDNEADIVDSLGDYVAPYSPVKKAYKSYFGEKASEYTPLEIRKYNKSKEGLGYKKTAQYWIKKLSDELE